MNIQKEKEKSKVGIIGKCLAWTIFIILGTVGFLEAGRYFDVARVPPPGGNQQKTTENLAQTKNLTSLSKAASSTLPMKGTVKSTDRTDSNSKIGMASTSPENVLVGSKNGHTFYYSSCSQAKKIKDDNKIWFSSVAAAEAAGYRPSKQCKTMKNP